MEYQELRVIYICLPGKLEVKKYCLKNNPSVKSGNKGGFKTGEGHDQLKMLSGRSFGRNLMEGL